MASMGGDKSVTGYTTDVNSTPCKCVSGAPTPEQTRAIDVKCNADADTAFTTAGGSADDLADAMANGASTAGTGAWSTCYNRELLAIGLTEKGKCTGPGGTANLVCNPDTTSMNGMPGSTAGNGWVDLTGDACANECTGAATRKQLETIQKKCDKEAVEKFTAAGGGSAEEFQQAKDKGAATTLASTSAVCFVTEFDDKTANSVCGTSGCSWEGQCDSVQCSPDPGCDMIGMVCGNGWKSDGSECSTKCTGRITREQEEKIQKKCENKAMDDFKEKGGNMNNWAKAKDEGAYLAGAAKMSKCFETAFKDTTADAVCGTSGCSWEGQCDSGVQCSPDPGCGMTGMVCGNGWKSDGSECSTKCTGRITREQEEKIHKLCEQDAKNEFIISGGDASGWEQSLKTGAVSAAISGMENCFDKAFDAKNYKWEGVCDAEKAVCFEGGYKADYSGYCDGECKGMVTMAELDKLHKDCDAKAKKDFIKNGGSVDDYDVAMNGGAGDAGIGMVSNCFDKAFENQNLKWYGTCDGLNICYDGGYKMDGTKCKKECTGFATMKQINDIHAACDEKGKQEFIKGGGDSDQWGAEMDKSAASAGVDLMANCFDKEFTTKNYKWEGTCDGTSKLCFEGGWEMVCSTPQCQCKCNGVVTQKQIEEIDAKCDEASKQEYVKNGGAAADWDMQKNLGAGLAGVKAMETCFDKKFKEQNLKWDGDCGGEVCWEGGYTMMGMCAKGTKCTGFATMAQIDDIHNQCDETARTDYMKGGGKVRVSFSFSFFFCFFFFFRTNAETAAYNGLFLFVPFSFFLFFFFSFFL